MILGGGSLLQDSTSWLSLLYYAALILTARLQRKPVILWAQGLGPLRRRRSRLLVGRLLPLVAAASWRDRSRLPWPSSLLVRAVPPIRWGLIRFGALLDALARARWPDRAGLALLQPAH